MSWSPTWWSRLCDWIAALFSKRRRAEQADRRDAIEAIATICEVTAARVEAVVGDQWREALSEIVADASCAWSEKVRQVTPPQRSKIAATTREAREADKALIRMKESDYEELKWLADGFSEADFYRLKHEIEESQDRHGFARRLTRPWFHPHPETKEAANPFKEIRDRSETIGKRRKDEEAREANRRRIEELRRDGWDVTTAMTADGDEIIVSSSKPVESFKRPPKPPPPPKKKKTKKTRDASHPLNEKHK